MKNVILIVALFLASSAWCAPYQVAAWTFGDSASLQAASDRAAIDEVDIDWYVSQRNLSVKGSGVDRSFVSAAHARGIKVFATVSNYSDSLGDFDPDLASGILAGKASSNKHISAIVSLCMAGGYDGVDLDWEALHPADRNRFSVFVTSLAKQS